jgi:hypothetical protein
MMKYATAQSLVSATPLISFAIVFGSPYALSSIAGGIASVAASSQLGNSMVDGSVSMKQQSYNNATKNQQQLAASTSMGSVINDGHVVQTTSQDGKYTAVSEQQDNLATNHVSTDADSASISQSLSGAKSKLAALTDREGKVTTLVDSQGKDWAQSFVNGTVTSENVSQTVIDTYKNGFTTGSSTEKGDTIVDSKSNGTNAHAGLDTPSAITAVTGVKGGASVTAANNHEVRTDMSAKETQAFNDAYEVMKSAAKTGSFTANNSADQKLGESYGANLSEQEQIATDKVKTAQDVKTYTEQASYVATNSGSINKNLNDAYFKEVMARHPEISSKSAAINWGNTHKQEAAEIGKAVTLSNNIFNTPEYKAHVAKMNKSTPSVDNTTIATPDSLKMKYQDSPATVESKAVVKDTTGAIKPIKEVVGDAAKSSNLVYTKGTGEILKSNLSPEEKAKVVDLDKERDKGEGSKAQTTMKDINGKKDKLDGIVGESTVARVVIKGKDDVIKANNAVNEYFGLKQKKENKDD